MFIRNFNSIKRNIIRCTEDEYEFLILNDFIPLSKDGKEWIFLDSDEINKCIKKYREKGGCDD